MIQFFEVKEKMDSCISAGVADLQILPVKKFNNSVDIWKISSHTF
jgi:hypothetical protein